MNAEQERRRPNAIDLSRLSYLIAGDNLRARNLLVQTLRNFNAIDVRESPDLHAASAMIDQRAPEIIFLVLRSGLAEEKNFLNFLRRGCISATGRIPAIAVSERTCVGDIMTALELGAASYISIPFRVATVEAHLLNVLRADKPHDVPGC